MRGRNVVEKGRKIAKITKTNHQHPMVGFAIIRKLSKRYHGL